MVILSIHSRSILATPVSYSMLYNSSEAVVGIMHVARVWGGSGFSSIAGISAVAILSVRVH
jgi:hypothetical protein